MLPHRSPRSDRSSQSHRSNGSCRHSVGISYFYSPEEFTHKQTDLVTSAMSHFVGFLDSLVPLRTEPHLDQALLKLGSLRNKISNNQLRVQNIPGAEPVYRTFKCFTNFWLEGPFRGNCQLFAQDVSFKAEANTDAWLNVIAAACDHLQLIKKIY